MQGRIPCFCDCSGDEFSINRSYSMPWLTGETVCGYWIHPDTLCWSGSFTFWNFEAYFAFRVHLENMTTVWARWSIPGHQLVSGMVSLSFLIEVEHVWRRFTWFWAKIHPERARAYHELEHFCQFVSFLTFLKAGELVGQWNRKTMSSRSAASGWKRAIVTI